MKATDKKQNIINIDVVWLKPACCRAFDGKRVNSNRIAFSGLEELSGEKTEEKLSQLKTIRSYIQNIAQRQAQPSFCRQGLGADTLGITESKNRQYLKLWNAKNHCTQKVMAVPRLRNIGLKTTSFKSQNDELCFTPRRCLW